MIKSAISTGALFAALAATSSAQITTFCSATTNSTGSAAALAGTGSTDVADDDLTLNASSLPVNSFGVMLVGRLQSSPTMPLGSSGNLCLSAGFGIYRTSVQQATNPGGTATMTIPLQSLPFPTGSTTTSAGDTLLFQFWYRDLTGTATPPTSNFTNGVSVQFDPPPISFSTDIVTGIFNQPGVNGGGGTCVGCHNAGNPGGGLDLSGAASSVFGRLVSQASTSSSCSGGTRVIPGDASGSVLFQVLDPTTSCSATGMVPPQAGTDAATIRDWIMAGAPNN